MKKLSLYLFSIFYGIAGVFHFIFREVYHTVIPSYLPYPSAINYISGTLEILVAVLIWIPLPLQFRINTSLLQSRKLASQITIIMLVAFIPAHIYFIQNEGCAGSFCLPNWIGWLRLVIIHPFLIYWAYKIRTIK